MKSKRALRMDSPRLLPRMRGAVAACALAALTLLNAIGIAGADADGPDYYRVVGVAADDVLNIRTEPTASAKTIGAIPPKADGVRNLGCKGGLSFAEWEKASPAERTASRRARWCRISYRGVEGWVAGRFLAEGSAPRN